MDWRGCSSCDICILSTFLYLFLFHWDWIRELDPDWTSIRSKNEQRLKEIIGTTLSFTFLIGLSLAVIGGFCHRYFTSDGDTCKYCGGKCGICQNPIHLHAHLISLFCLYNFLRGTGDSKTPFYFLMISTGTNILLLPILLFGWLGLPAFGLYGAAYSSVISTIVTFIILHIYLYKTKHPLRIDASVRKHLLMKGDLLKRY